MNAIRTKKKKKNDDDIATLSAVSRATSKKYLDDTGLGYLSSLIVSFVRNYASPKTHNHDGVYAKSSHAHTTSQITGLDSALAGKAPSSHTHSADNITSGVLPIGRGGTGASNSVVAASTMLNALEVGEAVPRDDDWYVAKYATNGNNTPLRRTHSALWGYIKSKTDPLYQPKGSYAASSHTHTIANVSNLQSTLDSKASVSHTHSNATATASGFMSNTDKSKLDGVSAGANRTTVDASFSATSTNPVQNKVVKAALDAKASSSHTHTTSQVSGLDAALAGKAPTSHTHTIAQVTNLQSQLDSKQPKGSYAAVSHSHAWSSITGKPSTFAPSSHNHTSLAYGSRVDGTTDWNTIPAGVHSVESSTPFNASKHAPVGAYTYGTVMVESDSSNINQIYVAHSNGEMWFRNRFSSSNEFSSWARVSISNHTHTTAQITGLDSALAGKAPTSHTHTIAQVTNLQSQLDSKQPKGSYAASSHTHSWSQITGKPTIPSALTYMPVGYVYISWSSTSPASLFGGSWTAITGRFPYFNAGTGTGGSNSHTLSINEMPKHRHILDYYYFNARGTRDGISYTSINSYVGNDARSCWYEGGNAPHNNMPSYQELYAWRRTE